MAKFLYGFFLSCIFLLSNSLSASTTNNSLVKEQNLSSLTQEYYTFLQQANVSETMQQTMLSLKNDSEAYYNNLTRYFGFRIVATILEYKIETNYKAYKEQYDQHLNQNPQSDLIPHMRTMHYKIEKEIRSWNSLKRVYANYPGHFL
jgi:hypothetical protein